MARGRRPTSTDPAAREGVLLLLVDSIHRNESFTQTRGTAAGASDQLLPNSETFTTSRITSGDPVRNPSLQPASTPWRLATTRPRENSNEKVGAGRGDISGAGLPCYVTVLTIVLTELVVFQRQGGCDE